MTVVYWYYNNCVRENSQYQTALNTKLDLQLSDLFVKCTSTKNSLKLEMQNAVLQGSTEDIPNHSENTLKYTFRIDQYIVGQNCKGDLVRCAVLLLL